MKKLAVTAGLWAFALACLLATSLAVPASAQVSDSEIVRDVERGARLELRNYAGSITVTTWDADRIRIEADVLARTIEAFHQHERTGLPVKIDIAGVEQLIFTPPRPTSGPSLGSN